MLHTYLKKEIENRNFEQLDASCYFSSTNVERNARCFDVDVYHSSIVENTRKVTGDCVIL